MVTIPFTANFNGSIDTGVVEVDTAGVINATGFGTGGKRLWVERDGAPANYANCTVYIDSDGLVRADLGAFCAVVRLSNYSDSGPRVSLSSGTDPVAAGHASIVYEYPDFWAGDYHIPGERVRSIDYLLSVIPRVGGGFLYVISGGRFGTFPAGTLVNVTNSGTTTPLYGHVANYDSRYWIDYAKALGTGTLPTGMGTRYGAALAADTFDRGSLGTTAEFGGQTYIVLGSTLSITSNQLDATNTSAPWDGLLVNAGAAARVIRATVNTTVGGRGVDVMFRANADRTQGLRYTSDHLTTALIRMDTGDILDQTGGWHIENSTTHEFVVYDYGDYVECFLDGQLTSYSTTLFNSNTHVGVAINGGMLLDSWSAWGADVTLHNDFGPFPEIPAGKGSVLYTANFTGTDGTAISGTDGWTASGAGTWRINGNKAWMDAPATTGQLLRSPGTAGANVQIKASITMPATTGAYPLDWYPGVFIRRSASNTYITARFLYQDNSPEVELWENNAGTQSLINYVQLGADSILPGSTHTLALAGMGDEVCAYFDGNPVVQMLTEVTGTGDVGIGIADNNPYGQPQFDDIEVSATVTSVPISVGGTLGTAGLVRKANALRVSGVLGLTPGGLLIRAVSTRIVGALTTAGSVSTNLDPGGPFTVNRAGTLTTAGAAIKRSTAKGLLGTLTTVGAVVRRVAKALVGAAGFAAAITKHTTTRESGVPGLAGAVVPTKVKMISVAGGLTTNGAIDVEPLRNVQLGGSVGLGGGMTLTAFRAPIPDAPEAVPLAKVLPPEFNLRPEEP